MSSFDNFSRLSSAIPNSNLLYKSGLFQTCKVDSIQNEKLH